MDVVCVGYESPNYRNKFLELKVKHFYHKFKFEVHEPIDFIVINITFQLFIARLLEDYK
jgi:hypothetical protein